MAIQTVSNYFNTQQQKNVFSLLLLDLDVCAERDTLTVRGEFDTRRLFSHLSAEEERFSEMLFCNVARVHYK